MRLQYKVAIVAFAVALTASTGGVARAAGPLDPAASTEPIDVGTWSAPFVEGDVEPTEWCAPQQSAEHDGKNVDCIPTAGSMAILGGPDVVYWDALEDMEEVETTVATEFGKVSVNDQSRRMDVDARTWSKPQPTDAGATADTHPLTPVPSDEEYNDGALFCAALTFLPDGRVLAVGGTAYYQDPSVPGTKYGLAELEGMDNARIYDPTHNRWTQAGTMKWGRWYPTLVPLANGTDFVASGVTKLIKPLYTDREPTDSGRNVVQTETYRPSSNPNEPGTWTENPPSANKSLPLFPRLHLLPGNIVYFNAAGQVFNPSGYAYDEVLWNQASVYEPKSQTWTDLGLPGMGTPAPGFRGSTFSIMLPLKPSDDGSYSKAEFLSAGGIIGTTPGTYFAVTDSRIDTVVTAPSEKPTLSSRSTASLNQPRWYGTGVLTPTGEVIAFSGASADEVDGPGTAMPVTTPELFDPSDETWRKLTPDPARAPQQRTYHNTAALLPDGRVLVGGHAPIGTLYGPPKTIVPGVTSPQETRNPTFEIYSPPYLFRGDRPEINDAPDTIIPGQTSAMTITLEPGTSADDITSVVLMRRTAITHLIDGGQRSVELKVLDRDGQRISVAVPLDSSVLPAGPYMLFVNTGEEGARVPSVSKEVTVAQGDVWQSEWNSESSPSAQAANRDLARAGAVPVDAELAFHEIAEINGHEHGPLPVGGDGRSIPWPVWPALAAAAYFGFWRLRHRIGGRAATSH